MSAAGRVVTRAGWRTMPWRNGGGVTHELWREPDTEPFGFRLSIAEVATDGPFSRFPGLDRVILMLEGRGFTLTRADGLRVALPVAGVPFAFHGEDDWSCALVDGPVLDFNVMVDRSRHRAAVHVIAPGDAAVLPPAGRGFAPGDRAFALALDDGLVVGDVALGRLDLVDVTDGATARGPAGARLVLVWVARVG